MIRADVPQIQIKKHCLLWPKAEVRPTRSRPTKIRALGDILGQKLKPNSSQRIQIEIRSRILILLDSIFGRTFDGWSHMRTIRLMTLDLYVIKILQAVGFSLKRPYLGRSMRICGQVVRAVIFGSNGLVK